MSAKKTSSPLPDSMPPRHRLVKLFWVLSPAFTRWAESHMDQAGMTPQRLNLMGLLCEHGPLTMSAIKNVLGVSATNITALVDALEKENMVVRRPHASDRRATLIELTAKAQKQIDENCGAFKEHVAELFTDFSEAEQLLLLDLLTRMRAGLASRGILKDAASCADACRSGKKD